VSGDRAIGVVGVPVTRSRLSGSAGLGAVIF
jgi:hypothetical protein